MVQLWNQTRHPARSGARTHLSYAPCGFGFWASPKAKTRNAVLKAVDGTEYRGMERTIYMHRPSSPLQPFSMSRALAGYIHFFWAGLAKQSQTGALFPSQRFLTERMIAPIPPGYSGQILELGAGTGALTVRLARRCPEARILACEINPTLAADTRYSLRQAGLASRVRLVSDSAEHLLAQMARNGSEKPNFILSGIPLGNFCPERTTAMLEAIAGAIRKGGMYIQFQYSLLDRRRIKATFSNLRTVPVFLNLPPAVIYYARK